MSPVGTALEIAKVPPLVMMASPIRAPATAPACMRISKFEELPIDSPDDLDSPNPFMSLGPGLKDMDSKNSDFTMPSISRKHSKATLISQTGSQDILINLKDISLKDSKDVDLEAGVKVSAPTSVPSMIKTPAEGFAAAVAAGVQKANKSAKKTLILSVLSGAYIGIGAMLMLTVGGAVPGLAESNPGLQKFVLGAIGVPVGLFLTVMTGAELFTGNTALVTMAVFEGKANRAQLFKNWIISYIGNLLGAIFLAALLVAAEVVGPKEASVKVAFAKTSNGFVTNLLRGIFCNWMVCNAVYIAIFAQDLTGKFIAMILPVMSFITVGLEHSVVNMFVIPYSIFAAGGVSWFDFVVKNLLPVTLGNIIGGVVCVACVFSYSYGKLGKELK